MKKQWNYALRLIGLAFLLTSCAAANKSAERVSETAAIVQSDFVMEDDSAGLSHSSFESAKMQELPDTEQASDATTTVISDNPQRKLIKNVNMTVESKNFDAYVKDIQKKAEEFGGYVSNLSLSGLNNDSYSYHRPWANIELRIPADALDSFLQIAQEGVNIRSQTFNTSDVTLQYYDTESHIKALKTEQDRLLELIASAESVDAILVIEARLSEVRYALENYNSQLRLLDNQVQYSTVYLDVYDVQEYQATTQTSYLEKIRIGFMENLRNVFSFISEFILLILTSLPTLLFLAILGILLVFVLRKLFQKFGSRTLIKLPKKQDKDMKNTVHTDKNILPTGAELEHSDKETPSQSEHEK